MTGVEACEVLLFVGGRLVGALDSIAGAGKTVLSVFAVMLSRESYAAACGSRGCGAGVDWDWIAALAKSAAVSVAAEKNGGEFFHPIGNTRGIATNGGWPRLDGKTTPNFGQSAGATSRR